MKRVRVGKRTFWTRGDEVIAFIEQNCVLTNGRWTGQPFKLLPWQRQLLGEMFEVDAEGRRRYRRALIGVGRKNGKTELAAALGLYFMLGDGEPSAEVYAAAASEEQADRVFEASKRMVEMSDTLRALVNVQVSRISVKEDPYSYMARLTSKGKTKHGLNIHCAVLDELHAWGAGEQEELWNALTTGMAAREQPFQLAITTAGTDLEDSRCGELYTLGKRILAGEVEDSSLFFRWWEAPEGADYRDPKQWREANPSYGETIDEGFYQDEIGSTPEAVFRRLYLNQWVEAAEFWLPPGTWEECEQKEMELAEGVHTFVGWDASTKHDSTAIVAAQKSEEDGTIRVRSRVWARPLGQDGHPIESWKLPIAECEAYVRELCETYEVQGVAYDPAFITWSADELAAQGLPLEEWPQTPSRMCPATEGLFEKIVQGQLIHDGDTVLARHLRSVKVREMRLGGQMLEKRSAGKQIDAAIALVMAVGLLLKLEPDEDQGVAFYFPKDDA